MRALFPFVSNFIKSTFFVFLISVINAVIYMFIEARAILPDFGKVILCLLNFSLCIFLGFLVGKHVIRKTPLLIVSVFFLPCFFIALLFFVAYILNIEILFMILEYPGFLIMEAFQIELPQIIYVFVLVFYFVLSFSVYLGSKFKKSLN